MLSCVIFFENIFFSSLKLYGGFMFVELSDGIQIFSREKIQLNEKYKYDTLKDG